MKKFHAKLDCQIVINMKKMCTMCQLVTVAPMNWPTFEVNVLTKFGTAFFTV